ncbi:hypothetical protein F5Y10DRAFT_233773 [Nemania abortiva]|nr:hypothetical protein F5Y10DRAFT_233773 [Nemania abortiva]
MVVLVGRWNVALVGTTLGTLCRHGPSMYVCRYVGTYVVIALPSDLHDCIAFCLGASTVAGLPEIRALGPYFESVS